MWETGSSSPSSSHWRSGITGWRERSWRGRNLSYIQSAKRLNSRQARWALFFGRFKFSLSYRPGSRKTKPDALSRLHSVDEGYS